MKLGYRSTINACYLGSFIQAVIINLTPILFIPLKDQLGLSFGELGLLVLVNFVTQVSVDLIFSGLIDRFGIRRFITAGHIIACVGLVLFALSPMLFENPFVGFLIATVIFSGAGGLFEIMLSPIVNNIPTDEKNAAMSILHSFFCWGQVAVVLVTTLLLALVGRGNWQWIVLGWALLPFLNFIFFFLVPLAPPVAEHERQRLRDIIKSPYFAMALILIACGGATELSVSQWSSAFMELGLGIPKVVGDVAGPCMFAVMMGLGRLFYGIYAKKIRILNMMMWGCALAVVCYLVLAFSSIPILSLVACALTGLAVSLLWPGTISASAARFPLAGASMFAIMAAAGDIGCSAGPATVGWITDGMQNLPFLLWLQQSTGMTPDQLGLRFGLLIAAIFPLAGFICVNCMKRYTRKERLQV